MIPEMDAISYPGQEKWSDSSGSRLRLGKFLWNCVEKAGHILWESSMNWSLVLLQFHCAWLYRKHCRG